MKLRYFDWDWAREGFAERLADLMKLFMRLLAMSAGDVERALEWLDRVAERYDLWDEDLDTERFRQELESRGLIGRGDGDGAAVLTPRGEKSLKQDALMEIFGDLLKGGGGEHVARATGPGVEREPTIRDWRFGDDPAAISPTDTLRNAVGRSLTHGDDLTVREEDLAVWDTEADVRCATALLVDCSHSMVLYGEDRMTPARRTAMALVELIQTRFPKDRLHVIAFGDDAFEVPLNQVPYLNWGRWHTNTHGALRMARDLLERSKCPNRRIFMITDGKPTVLDEPDGRLIDSGWLNPRIVAATLDEAAQCRRRGIRITTFMVAEDPYLREFVDELTDTNGGQAFHTGLGRLGATLFTDFLRNRKRSI